MNTAGDELCRELQAERASQFGFKSFQVEKVPSILVCGKNLDNVPNKLLTRTSTKLSSLHLATMECTDFLEFQDLLKKMRDVDDKLVYALNCSIPSPSFRSEINPATNCKELYAKLQENHNNRDKAIRNCIEITSQRVQELKKARDANPSAAKAFNKELTKLRLLRSELNVEEVVQDRSSKLYYERCRDFFKPPEMNVN